MAITVPWLCIPINAKGKAAKLLVKDEGIIAGVDFAKRVFNFVDPGLEIKNIYSRWC